MKPVGVTTTGRRVGEYVPGAKLTFEQVDELRAMRRHGVTFKALGVHFGIHPATAHKIATGKAWASPVASMLGEATQADAYRIAALAAQGFGYARIGKEIGATGSSVLRVMKANGLSGKSIPLDNLKKTHCKHGHQLSGDNLVARADGARGCRTCMRAADQRFKAKKRKEGTS